MTKRGCGLVLVRARRYGFLPLPGTAAGSPPRCANRSAPPAMSLPDLRAPGTSEIDPAAGTVNGHRTRLVPRRAQRHQRPARRRAGRALRTTLICVVLVSLAVAGTGTAVSWLERTERERSAHESAQTAATRFLDDYVAQDGRVVRYDQGGDTVSEGQAYAMLAAVVIGDEERFRRVWAWARANLQQEQAPLMAWLWQDGKIQDQQAASDADVDAAHALLLAAERFGDPGLRTEALTIGRAVLDQQTAVVGDEIVLAAGPWATTAPVTVNPSYFAPRAFSALAAASGDPRWARLTTSSQRIMADLTENGQRLPPDWARIDADGTAVAIPGPSGAEEPGFGFDAARAPLRYAMDCDVDGRELAASMGNLLGDGGTVTHELDGTPRERYEHAAGFTARAAVATAAGSPERAEELLQAAEELERSQPTYYGSALVALTRGMVTSDTLGACAD